MTTWILVAGLALAASGLSLRVRLWCAGAADSGRLVFRQRAYQLWRRTITQTAIRSGGWRAPLMHGLVFWGFWSVLLATGLELLARRGLLVPAAALHWLPALREAAGAALLAGAWLAVHRRYVRRWQRLSLDLPGDGIALGLLCGVPLSGFLAEGARLALVPGSEPTLLVGRAVAGALVSLDLEGPRMLAALRTAHVGTVAALLGALPFTRLRHAILAPLSVLLTARAPGAPTARALADGLSWALRLQLDACSGCGRCDVACPRTGRAGLSPMRLLFAQRADPSAPGIPDAALDACTSCGECEMACPIGIAHVERIEILRRARVSPPARSSGLGASNLADSCSDRTP